MGEHPFPREGWQWISFLRRSKQKDSNEQPDGAVKFCPIRNLKRRHARIKI